MTQEYKEGYGEEDVSSLLIQHATTNQLIDELGRRCDAIFVVAATKVRGTYDNRNSRQGVDTQWRGGWVAALGLAKFGLWDIEQICLKPDDREEVDDPE